MSEKPLTVVELATFLRAAEGIWTIEEREAFVEYIAYHPEAGDLIPETGGLRKIRWQRQGIGKRGGARVVYFYYNLDAPLYLITAYAKAVQSDLSPQDKKKLSRFVAELKSVLKA